MMSNDTTTRERHNWVDYVPTYGAPNVFTIDGQTYRSDTAPDESMTIMDEQGEGVWCGRLEWSDERPDGFDGGAEIIHRDRGDRLWWQPLDDCVRDPEIRNAVRSTIRDIFEYGYSIVTVERLEECDHGHSHVVDSESLGGIGPGYDAMDLAEIVAELVDELAERVGP